MSILFADDDPFYREIATAALTEAGYDVTGAPDGTAAAESLAARVFSLAILDLDMPGKDGFEVIRSARAGGANAETPIIVLTGHDDAMVIENAYQAGATSFLVKPVNWPLFVQHVRFVLKSAQSEAELRETSRIASYLSDLKSNILSTLVTEFYSPLRNANAYVTLLRREADGPITSDMYRQAIEDLSKMVDQLGETHIRMLNFGRILGETIRIDETVWSPERVIKEVVDALHPRAARRNITIAARMTLPPQTEVRGDRALVALTIKSLLANAIRFAPRKSTVTLDVRLDPARGFMLTIEDDAPSLSPTQIAEMLALPQAKTSVGIENESERNTSLTVGRLLVEAHQGELTLSPLPEVGNRGRMCLPLDRVVHAQVQPSAVQVPAARPEAVRPAPIMTKQAGVPLTRLRRPPVPVAAK